MKKSYRVIAPVMLVLSLLSPHRGVAADAGGAIEGIEEAKNLYAQALPMDITSPRRAEILDQAATLLQKVIEEHPKSLDAHRKLMGVYLLKQDYSRAIRTMQDAITLSPEDPKLFISLAFLYEHSGDLDLANGMLSQALKLDPGNSIAQDYKLVIQQKIDTLNDPHRGQGMPGMNHGKPISPHNG